MNCRNCKHLTAPKYPPPGPAIGTCAKLSSIYGADLAWSEIGNQFLSVWVGPDFGCIQFERAK